MDLVAFGLVEQIEAVQHARLARDRRLPIMGSDETVFGAPWSMAYLTRDATVIAGQACGHRVIRGDGDAARMNDIVRTKFTDLIFWQLFRGELENARATIALAVAQGVWKHPLQRPPHYIPSLPAAPLYDPGQFSFVPHLEQAFAAIRAEVDAVTDPLQSGFNPVEEGLVDQGRWDQVVLFEGGHRFDHACRRFPVTTRILESIPEATRVGSATLSWLHPGTHVVPHCGYTNTRLRVHMGIKVPPGPELRVADQRLHWSEGRCLIFDDSFEHEVWHRGSEPRVVLLFDILHPSLRPEEQAALVREQVSFEARVRSFMEARGLARMIRLSDDDAIVLMPDLANETAIRRYMRDAGALAVALTGDQLSFEWEAEAARAVGETAKEP
jgi:aspartate beta-hydroxylase